MKKSLSVLLVLCLLLSVFPICGIGESAPESDSGTREFTDSVGRTVIVPDEITSVAVSGPLSQVYLLPLAGDMLVGVSNGFAESAELYLPG